MGNQKKEKEKKEERKKSIHVKKLRGGFNEIGSVFCASKSGLWKLIVASKLANSN
jgi:hypothetical protein